MSEIQLKPLEPSDREQFIRDNQEAFRYGALEEFGQRDDHFEEEGEIISRQTIELSIDGGRAYRILQDGKPVGGTVDLTTGPADMGKNLLCYFGKSFYKDDTGFAGAIDNAAVYRCALTPDEVKALSGGTGALRGDVNADGTVSIADAVMMQKFLLCEGTVTDWQAGDLDGNRRLNAVDFALLKRILISGSH